MQKLKIKFSVVLIIGLFIMASSSSVASGQPVPELNKFTLVDTSDESVILTDFDFVTNTKIESGISNNKLQFETETLNFKEYVIDTTETSIGSHSTDWIGNPDDPSSGAGEANAGEGYWMFNASTNPVSSSTTSEATASTHSSTIFDPSQSGYYWQHTISRTDDTDSGIEGSYAYNELDGGSLEGVDWTIDANSYLYINLGVTITNSNVTDYSNTAPSAGLAVIISDGTTNYFLIFSMSLGSTGRIHHPAGSGAGGASEVATGAWIDSYDGDSVTAGVTPVSSTGSQLYSIQTDGTSGTEYEAAILFNIQDRINLDDETADKITAQFVKGIWMYSTSAFSDTESVRFKVKQTMFGSAEDFMIHDDGTTIDQLSSADKSANLINGTTVTVDDLSKWEIGHEEELFPAGSPLNRLTINSAAKIYLDPLRSVLSLEDSKDAGITDVLRRDDFFDMSWGSEEPEYGIDSSDGFDVNITNMDDAHELAYTLGGMTTVTAEDLRYYLFKINGEVDTSNFGTLVNKAGTSFTTFSDLYASTPSVPFTVDLVEALQIVVNGVPEYGVIGFYDVAHALYDEYLETGGDDLGALMQIYITGRNALLSIPEGVFGFFGFTGLVLLIRRIKARNTAP